MPAPADTSLSGDVLSRRLLLFYGLPFAAYTAVSMPLSLWLLKYTSDVLLIAPAAMGTAMLVARMWDAVSDPMAGYLSDRTTSRLGRRRSWLLASAPFMALTLVMVWSPPSTLSPTATLLWVAAALVLWETASTAFYIPHHALGLELTRGYNERTRLFAWRHVVSMLGYACALVLLEVLRRAEAPRDAAFAAAVVSGVLLGAIVAACALGIREPTGHQGRGGVQIRRAFADVLRNPHARILFLVYAVELFGVGLISVLGVFIVEDVVRRPGLLTPLLACYLVPQFALAPLWMKLAQRVGKKRLWSVGLCISTVGFAGLGFITEDGWVFVLFLVMIIGTGLGVGSVISPSIQADVVDYDEMETGERKEGAYAAVWNFIRKAGMAGAAGAGGYALSFAGYDGAAEVQSDEVGRAIRLTASILPVSFYVCAFFLLQRFQLDEAAHREMRQRIADRSGARPR